MIIYNKTRQLCFVSVVRQTFLGFEMASNFRDTSPLRASRNGKIENIWPSSNGKFLLPPGTTNATVALLSSHLALKNIKTRKILRFLHLAFGRLLPKLPKSCFFHEKVVQKLLFINSKKSVSTTDESKSLHIYANYLLIYIFLSTR